MKRTFVFLLLVSLVLSACAPEASAAENPPVTATNTLHPQSTPTDTPIPTATSTPSSTATLTATLTPTGTFTPTAVQIVIVSNGKVCELDRQGVFHVCGGSSFAISGLPEGATYLLFAWNRQGTYDRPYFSGIGAGEIRPRSPAVHVQVMSEGGIILAEFDVYLSGLAATSTPAQDKSGNGGAGQPTEPSYPCEPWPQCWGQGTPEG